MPKTHIEHWPVCHSLAVSFCFIYFIYNAGTQIQALYLLKHSTIFLAWNSFKILEDCFLFSSCYVQGNSYRHNPLCICGEGVRAVVALFFKSCSPCFETGSLCLTWTLLDSQQAVEIHLSASPVLGLEACATVPSFLCECWRLNSGLHVYEVRILLTDPSTQPIHF